jgi:hypothetical protein
MTLSTSPVFFMRTSGVVASAAEGIGPLQRQKWIDLSPSRRNTVACCFNHHVHNDWNATLFGGLEPFLCSFNDIKQEDAPSDFFWLHVCLSVRWTVFDRLLYKRAIQGHTITNSLTRSFSQWNILREIRKRKANWIGQILLIISKLKD